MQRLARKTISSFCVRACTSAHLSMQLMKYDTQLMKYDTRFPGLYHLIYHAISQPRNGCNGYVQELLVVFWQGML